MKRWIAALLSAVLLLSVSGAALAADPDTVEISSAEDLAELSALCTSDAWSEGKTIVLTRDISLTGCDFSPIPLLAGTFDGRGHSILGISLDGDASTQGLFRMVLKTGVVKNLTVSGTLRATGNGENIGGIAGVNYGAIENCRFDGDILAQAAAGGIVGLNQEGALVSECKTSGSISAYHRAGGIAGENRGVLSECENRMSVNTDYIAVEKPVQKKSFDISTLTLNEETIIDITDLGGIAGLNTSVIKYCDNYGDVGYPHTGYNVGGIAGRQSGRVLGCTNAGEVTARKDVGGIVGQVEPYTSWNVTGTGLGEVQSQLYRLESLLRTTLGDFGDSQAEASALMQQILELLGNCSDIIGGMYPDIPWPTPGGDGGSDTGDTGGGSDNGDAGSGDDSTGGWIDPGSGSMDDLSDNLQQIVNLLGQMTDVFTSDAVIEDMQNVLSQLMNVSSAIMSMAYSLGNASVQLEDISDTDDDDEALCLIAQCANTASITADTNVGGIAGLGKDISSCGVMPHFENRAELCGSVAGYADGTIAENLYSDSTVGGVDGFSFTGQSDYMDYEDFAALPDTPDFFRSIGVTFVKDGVTVETVEVPFGGKIASLPAVADEDGMYWQWNDFDPNEAVYYSRTVEGEYIRPVTTISTGEDEPLFLAEGTFRDGQTLLAVPFVPDAETLGIGAASILAAYTVRVSDYSQLLTVRMLTSASGSLYTLSEGTLTPLSFTRDGSYIVFRLDNGTSIVYLAQETSRTGWIIGGIAGGAAAAAAVVLIIVRKRRKKT